MPAVCLSLHADYACERSGACCTSGWPIHVESGRLAAWGEALAAGRMSYEADSPGDGTPLVVPPDLRPGAGAVMRTRASGACVFYREDDGLCAVQRGLGHSSLPAACQHFPRRCLIEPDRVAVSLSHYCPTVARLAFRADLASTVVPAPSSLVGHFALEGLDATEALPPTLRPGVLADRDTYRAWEGFALEVLGLDIAPECALDLISALTEELRLWKPSEGSLGERLAAHAFGSWCAYNGHGLRTVVRSLDVALKVVRVEAARACAEARRPLDQMLLIEAFRAADLLLVHLADPAELAERLGAVEQG